MNARSGHRLIVLAVVLASAMLAGSVPFAGRAAGPQTPPPVRKVALGVSMLPWQDLAVLDQFTIDSGRKPAVWSVWSDWVGPTSAFNAEVMAGIRDRGITPLVFWQPVDSSDLDSTAFSYYRINQGDWDAYLREWAAAARDHEGPILLRFAHEMNGYWFPWSVDRPGNEPRKFKRAWQRIWNIFKGPGGEGATNVRFLWAPNDPCSSCTPYNKIYPGDAYVDYVGFTAFNWGAPYRWNSMVQTFTDSMKALKAVAPTKKVVVAETGTSPVGGNKPNWIRDGYLATYDRWPRIRLIVYFNVDAKTIAGQPDWRLTTPTKALERYRAILGRRKFQGSFP